jgi:hypothetical protein
MSEATFAELVALAAAVSTPDRKVSPMQVAAQLLEEAVGRTRAEAACQFQPSAAQGVDQTADIGRATGAPGRPAADDPDGRPPGDAKDPSAAVEREAAPNGTPRGERHQGRRRKS